MNNRYKEDILKRISELHISPLCEARLILNIKPNKPVVDWCKEVIRDDKSRVTLNGRNYYIQLEHIALTVTTGSLAVISAHYLK